MEPASAAGAARAGESEAAAGLAGWGCAHKRWVPNGESPPVRPRLGLSRGAYRAWRQRGAVARGCGGREGRRRGRVRGRPGGGLFWLSRVAWLPCADGRRCVLRSFWRHLLRLARSRGPRTAALSGRGLWAHWLRAVFRLVFVSRWLCGRPGCHLLGWPRRKLPLAVAASFGRRTRSAAGWLLPGCGGQVWGCRGVSGLAMR